MNLFLPHGVVWDGEVRRLWRMKMQVMARLCGYTSAGAGPVSLGLVVTMLALLLTCRGQCRGDMTNIHFTLVHGHTGYGPFLRNLSRTSQQTVNIRQDFAPTNQYANILWWKDTQIVLQKQALHFCQWSLAVKAPQKSPWWRSLLCYSFHWNAFITRHLQLHSNFISVGPTRKGKRLDRNRSSGDYLNTVKGKEISRFGAERIGMLSPQKS